MLWLTTVDKDERPGAELNLIKVLPVWVLSELTPKPADILLKPIYTIVLKEQIPATDPGVKLKIVEKELKFSLIDVESVLSPGAEFTLKRPYDNILLNVEIVLRFVALIAVERELKLLSEIFDNIARFVLRLERPGAELL